MQHLIQLRSIFGFLILGLFLLPFTAVIANEPYNGHTDFEKYSVYYNIFDSTTVPADVAAIYGIKRSKYENLINVSISHKGKYGALKGTVRGTITNLMQQQRILDFMEIQEQDATYYIAPIRISGKDTVHIALEIVPSGENTILPVKFTKILYSE
ncbi:MAG: hypothetical protein ACI93R_001827 [Flavobacteriales bacterium]|jgi:hypothetical protein